MNLAERLAAAMDGQAAAPSAAAAAPPLPATPAAASAEQRHLRDVFGRFATGVTVVAAGSEAPRGMTANSFTSVSLDPPLILICASRTALIHEAVMACGSFAVSILSAGQEDVARYFADHSRPRGAAEFARSGWWPAPSTGAPVLHGALAWVECALWAMYDGGDHSIFLGLVLAGGCGSARDGLLFFGGDYHHQQLERIRRR